MFRDTPNLAAILAFGTPSAASLLINAQSSIVITLPSLKSAHFSSAATAQFSSAVEIMEAILAAPSIVRGSAAHQSAVSAGRPCQFDDCSVSPPALFSRADQDDRRGLPPGSNFWSPARPEVERLGAARSAPHS